MKASELKYKDGEVVYNVIEKRFFNVKVITVRIQGNVDFYGLFELDYICGFTSYRPIKYDDVISKHEYRKLVIQDLL